MVAAMLLSGTIGLVVIESGLPVEPMVVLRCLLGALGLGAWLWWRHAWVAPSRADWRCMALGGVALVANWVALFHAYAYVGIAVATVVYHVQPFLLVLAAALGGEAFGWRQLPWMLLALAGVVLTSGLGMIGAVSMGSGGAFSMPLQWTIMATLGLVMMAIFAYIYFALLDRLERAVAASDWSAGGQALARMRTWVGINLLIGVLIVVQTLLM